MHLRHRLPDNTYNLMFHSLNLTAQVLFLGNYPINKEVKKAAFVVVSQVCQTKAGVN